MPSNTPNAVSAILAILLISVALGACGGDSEPTEDDLARHESAAVLLARGGVQLDASAAACVADKLDDDLLVANVELDEGQAADVADTAVDCLGSPAIARASVAAVTGGASEDSIECAASTFNSDLVASLLASALRDGSQSGPEVEIELSRSLSVCLTLSELGSLIE